MGLENPLHILIILVVVLMVFGAKRLPEMGRGLGDGMRGFKDAISGNSPAPAAMTAAEPTLEPTPASSHESTPATTSVMAESVV
jgi:sec-independent protein translocase protein TatA